MRATRTAPVVAAALALLVGVSVAAVTPVYEAETLPISGIAGTVTLETPPSLGDFSVDQGVFQYRGVPSLSSTLVTSDGRLNGTIDSNWNWDTHRSGSQPEPAWGTMRIDVPAVSTFEDEVEKTISVSEEGAWEGTFTGIRRADLEPFMVRAFLFGQGAYEGLCATLDIEAGADAWMIDGVIHRVPMAG
jgi:hypothetical protein